MNKPIRYIARKALPNELVSFHELMNYYQNNVSMVHKIKELEYHVKQLKKMNLYAAINYIRKGIGYEHYLEDVVQKKNNLTDSNYNLNNKASMNELINIMDRLQETAKQEDDFQSWIEKYLNDKKENKVLPEKNKDAIPICTMHGAKGLEYQTVIIPGMNEGNIPYGKSISEETLEEERRLLYVAMTRAKERLILTFIKENRESAKQKSRFLKEIFSIE